MSSSTAYDEDNTLRPPPLSKYSLSILGSAEMGIAAPTSSLLSNQRLHTPAPVPKEITPEYTSKRDKTPLSQPRRRRYGQKLGLPPKSRPPLAPVKIKPVNREANGHETPIKESSRINNDEFAVPAAKRPSLAPVVEQQIPPKHSPIPQSSPKPEPHHQSPMENAAAMASPRPPPLAMPPAARFEPPPPSPAALNPPPPFVVSPHDSSSRIFFVNDRQYKPVEVLGSGGSSKVYKVRDAKQNTWALKRVKFDKFDDQIKQSFAREITLLLKLAKSDRVVYLHDYAINDDELYLVMELGERDLAHIIHPRLEGRIEPETHLQFVRFYTSEILSCLREVHAAGIVHSDLKPANFIFIRGKLKVIDFGIADALGNTTMNIYRNQQIGTPNYMAPEAVSEAGGQWKVGKPSDVWSMGCMVYQMIYGQPPYANIESRHRLQAIRNPQHMIKFRPHGVGGLRVPPSVLEFLRGTLERNPDVRWTVEQGLSSAFLRPPVISNSVIRDIVHEAINFGHRHGGRNLTVDDYDQLVASAVRKINGLEWTYTGVSPDN
ncbi:hypothetical protein DIURU_001148 [Diutina rugosa]|uniref:Protein kinase domain-containing protein n=1 Tax=Diutina rugosa TaxID=5481 RepID=A0A642UX59_DIURU|nr:uncharacterized protein DIURU_001148 [Diutina rugosa]KAA8906206.1 hypothetical protein DIURU_001148 [Diutina rugosa]